MPRRVMWCDFVVSMEKAEELSRESATVTEYRSAMALFSGDRELAIGFRQFFERRRDALASRGLDVDRLVALALRSL